VALRTGFDPDGVFRRRSQPSSEADKNPAERFHRLFIAGSKWVRQTRSDQPMTDVRLSDVAASIVQTGLERDNSSLSSHSEIVSIGELSNKKKMLLGVHVPELEGLSSPPELNTICFP
jgi:hypothetical protein